MKKKRYLIIACMSLIFCSFGVHAENDGYLVQFCRGYEPDGEKYFLETVNEERGIYLTNSLEALEPIKEYIEYSSPNSEVHLIEGEPTISTFSLPTDMYYSDQWQLQLINADAGWKKEAYGNDIKVAVIDSGCFPHDDLKDNLLDGKNYLDGTKDVTDNDGHGTHVSGIIAAQMNDIGIAGVAPEAKIVPLKCFDPSQSTYVKDILDAIYDAVDVYDCKVINMSWGIGSNSSLMKEAVDYAYDKGVILVAAVGNYSGTSVYYPAGYQNVIGVTSVGMNKKKSSFSQYNNSVNIAASGEKVKSTYNNGGYAEINGTSQATPMISGLAAVCLSMDESLDNSRFIEFLTETAEDLGTAGYDKNFGYGLADGNALIDKMMESMEYYVSPVNVKDDEAYVLIRNNTEDVLKASSIFSGYKNGEFIGCTEKKITLLPGREMIVKSSSADKTAHFLWGGLKGMKPITIKREKK